MGADWANVVVSLLALCTAVYAGIHANKLYRFEQKKNEQNIRDKKRSHAAKISAWVADVRRSAGEWTHVGIVIQNLSEEPIYNLHIDAFCQKQTDKHNQTPIKAVPLKIDLLPPGIYYCKARHKNNDYVDFIALSEYPTAKSLDAWEDVRPYSEFTPPPIPVTATTRRSVASLTFTDSANQKWIRQKDGRLVEC